MLDMTVFGLQLWVVVVIFLVVLFLLIGIYAYSRSVHVINGLYTYIIVSDDGFKEALTSPKILWNPFLRVLKGDAAPNLSYDTYASEDPTSPAEPVALLKRETGFVNLREQVFECPEFIVSTADPIQMVVFARITFQLDINRLKDAIKIEDFGRRLRKQIEEFFRDEIGKVGDEEIGLKNSEIRANVLKAMQQQQIRKSFGVTFLDVGFHARVKDADNYGAGGAAADKSHVRPMEIVGADKINMFRDMLMPKAWLDPKISQEKRDEYYQKVHEIMLEILEMQTRQNIADALTNSGSLVIMSSEELGLNKGNFLREPIRSYFQELQKRASNDEGDGGEPSDPQGPQNNGEDISAG